MNLDKTNLKDPKSSNKYLYKDSKGNLYRRRVVPMGFGHFFTDTRKLSEAEKRSVYAALLRALTLTIKT